MRLTVCAVGRLRAGPERDLIDDYAARAERAGRGMGLGPVSFAEVEDKKGGGKSGEAALLARALPAGARVIALDERGKLLKSPDFAARLADWRDGGAQDAAILIGGADGLDPSLRARADLVLSLGHMVWPHMLARVMLAEQIYRATQILAGTPYHRE
ncbi:LSU m3Psi1915 methyltransferase RlmH [Candidatus Rhodobacter oscarellae]|uniref:Ribosomal RNA large subunit methyltransferase H n=1 Tax=Candidatus Rhodobacter oscarellae TaxID=1675527 RepID=A0A0J9EDA9_9RHOB|nr:23S rRNA (pseudouridine(1915)-N(3))-methyltransferase RlmH [Candidatus Rhodobacter lobularis]KMW60651.1 LSU m3Psi1915 methyltransferase RlmH [Candidatus Rhodobacter lobularis]